MIKDVTDLEVYAIALNLLPEIYELTNKLPKSEYDLVLQIRRSSKSIPANIAEGFGKRSSDKEFKRFLKIAIGSSDETITHLRMIAIIQPKLSVDASILAEKYKVLSKRINSLSTKWQSGGNFRPSGISDSLDH
jgi:four helix bundle protein